LNRDIARLRTICPLRAVLLISRPPPGRYAAPFHELAKRRPKNRARLHDLLAIYFETHRGGNNDMRFIAGQKKRGFVQSNGVFASISAITSLYQSRVAVGSCHPCGTMPSRIEAGTVKVAATCLY
jgi:hypothetical protein